MAHACQQAPCLLCIPWVTHRRVRRGQVDRSFVEAVGLDTIRKHPGAEPAVNSFLSAVGQPELDWVKQLLGGRDVFRQQVPELFHSIAERLAPVDYDSDESLPPVPWEQCSSQLCVRTPAR